MSIPTFEIGVAFGDSPLEVSPTFTDIAEDMESFSLSRGRQSENDQAQTGHADISLVDTERTYDDNNVVSPYYPDVKAAVPVRIRATLEGITYDVIKGWADAQGAWVREESEPGAANVSLPINDAFELLVLAGSANSSDVPTSETQEFYVQAEGGTYTLTFDGQTTAAIDYNDSSADVQTALEALSNIAPGDVTVSQGVGGSATKYVHVVEFGGTYAGVDVEELIVNTGGLDAYGENAKRSIRLSEEIPGDTGGTFTITFEGQTTAPIAFNANAATVDAALEALSNIGVGDVTCSAYDPGGAGTTTLGVLVEFTGALAESARTFSIDTSGITQNFGWSGSSVGNVQTGFQVTTLSDILTYPPSADDDEMLTGTRIAQAMAVAGLGGTDLDEGASYIQSLNALYGQSEEKQFNFPILGAIRDAEITDSGFFFFAKDGTPTFRDRHQRLENSTSQATFCDGENQADGRIPYSRAVTRRSLLINDVVVTPAGSSPQHAEDTDSKGEFLTRQKTYSTAHITEAEALAYAQWQISLRKDSYETIEALTLIPGADTDIWTQILERELNDRITIIRTPAGGGDPVEADYFIEGIQLSFGPGVQASCTWRLSQSAAQFSYWLAEVVGFSEAGTTTKAAY